LISEKICLFPDRGWLGAQPHREGITIEPLPHFNGPSWFEGVEFVILMPEQETSLLFVSTQKISSHPATAEQKPWNGFPVMRRAFYVQMNRSETA
jgi:hypothetical protein